MSLTVEYLTGKSERERLCKLIEGVPKLKTHSTGALTAKMWVTPSGEIIPLHTLHWELFRSSPELAATYGITVTDDQGTRLSALAAGFTRLNYERNSGTLTLESGISGWTRRKKDVIFMLIMDNAESIDNIRVTVMHPNGQIAQSGYAQLFRYSDKEKLEHIPLISESQQGRELLSIIAR